MSENISSSAQAGDPWARLRDIELLAMDVDGVLTNGTLGCTSDGTEQKGFHVHDGLALTFLMREGIRVAWISGRRSAAVENRARELGITLLIDGVRDKHAALVRLGSELNIRATAIAYIGDDWNDSGAFLACGVRVAVANARPELRRDADFVTDAAGGHGAVREVCEAVLRAKDIFEDGRARYLDALRESGDHAGQ